MTQQEDEFAAALRAAAPGASDEELAHFAALLRALLHGDAPPTPTANPDLRTVMEALAGRELRAADSLLSFGDHSQLGDVTIRDIAHGNIYHINLNLGSSAPKPDRPSSHSDAATHTAELIARHRKMLHQLELQSAKFGIYCPPHITIEIDELKQKIAQLERELRIP